MSARVVNIASRLTACAHATPLQPALVLARDGRSITFAELSAEINRCAAGLLAVGVQRQQRVLLFVPPGVEFFALTFALFKIGAVPVLIDPGLGAAQMAHCLSAVELHGFIGVPKAQLFRLLYRVAFKKPATVMTVGRRWGWGGHTLEQVRRLGMGRTAQQAETRADDPAAILFTSGSTGPAKGVLYSHGNFDAQVELLRTHFGYDAGAIDFATFPLFALFDAALGATCVIPRMDFSRPGGVDAGDILRQLEQHRCTHMFGSPALLERVGTYAREHGIRLPQLRRVITAGAPVRPQVLEIFAGLLCDDAEILTPYGATEALPVTSISHREILAETAAKTRAGAGMCVGRPLAGTDVRIIEIDDEPIADMSGTRELQGGEIGEIVVAGLNVTGSYWNLPWATALGKMSDEGGRVWHRMGDVGYFDERGRLWFCGRKSHRVQTARGTLFTEPVEARFNEHPLVRRTALVGIGAPGRQMPVLCVECEERYTWKKVNRISEELTEIAAANPQLRQIRSFLICRRFPVDVRHNAKIRREKLAVEAARILR